MLAVGELGIDLVGYHHNIGAPQHLRQGLKVLPVHDAAGGVVGEGEHQNLGAGSDGGFQLLGGEAELVFHLGLHVHGYAVNHGHQGPIAHEGGGGDDDLVPRLQQTAEGQIQALTAAHGDQGLADGLILQVKPPLQIAADGPAQVGESGVGGVLGKALFQGVDARIPDVPGGLEVRLSHAQGDGVVHLRHDVKVFPNAGGRHFLNALA